MLCEHGHVEARAARAGKAKEEEEAKQLECCAVHVFMIRDGIMSNMKRRTGQDAGFTNEQCLHASFQMLVSELTGVRRRLDRRRKRRSQ